MARKISMKQAINEALDQEMARDPSVILMGEDIVGGAGGDGERDAWGGVLGVTKGLYAKHGDRCSTRRCRNRPTSVRPSARPACGMRPVAELMFIDFMGVCFDQIFNQAAKFKYMFGGKAETPVVIRAMYGAGFRAAAQHSQMPVRRCSPTSRA
jgi:pyruvate/2-oxoglutarate/acetoin dehydrogenase E1 component